MRFRDIIDYWRLRKHLVTPWAFMRMRKRGLKTAWHDFALKGGGRLRVRNAPMDMHIMHRVLGRDEYALSAFAPGSLNTIIDVGAHLGFFSLLAARLGLHVFALEPFDENFELLKSNIAHLPNVLPLCLAMSDQTGEQEFHVSANPSAGSFHPVERHPVKRVVRVPSLTVTDFFQKHRVTRCDLLKIDAEGSEYSIVYSVPDELWRVIRFVCLEYDPIPNAPAGWTGEELERHFRKVGYRVRRVPSKHPPGRGKLWAVREEEPAHPWR